MSNLTKPQRKQLEKQISEAQEKLRMDDIQKCLDRRSKAIMKAMAANAECEVNICVPLLDEKYSNAAVEKAFTALFRDSYVINRFVELLKK